MHYYQFYGFYSFACLPNQRIHIHKTFEGLATRGKCSMGWFFGFKLHLINDKGEILTFMFTTANVNGKKPLKQGSFLSNIKEKLCADKGYIGKTLSETLFLNGIQLITKIKNNMNLLAFSHLPNYFQQSLNFFLCHTRSTDILAHHLGEGTVVIIRNQIIQFYLYVLFLLIHIMVL